jgi:ribonuclease Y
MRPRRSGTKGTRPDPDHRKEFSVEVLYILIGAAAGLALGFGVRHFLGRQKLLFSEREAEGILKQAEEAAERARKDAEIKAQEGIFKKREEFEREAGETRNELKSLERRLTKREESLDRKIDLLDRKEGSLAKTESKLGRKREELRRKEEEIESLVTQQKEKLHEIARMSDEEAREELFKQLESDLSREISELIHKRSEDAKENAESKARYLIINAIQRYASDCTAENVTSTIDIANDEMKGRIIGREGRNIRAFEKATGVDVIVDDTPGLVVVSGFDSVRREIARRAMEKLILDGRIHPSRIEDIVAATRKEVEDQIRQTGKQVCYDMGIHNVHPKIINALGRLQFRTSYGQNVLQHSVEVARIAALMAADLKLDTTLAKRCGLFHDIGKALDHEAEGGHPEIGADLAKRSDESREVVDAVGKHHEDGEGRTVYTVLIAAADAISASRPGARRETFDKYIKRLEKLEEVANSFQGVENSYAIQAGREVRVLVDADKVDDESSIRICRDIARRIQDELSYPGEVKVTLIREKRIIEYAK